MRTKLLVLTLSILTAAFVIACGTTDEDIPIDAGSDTDAADVDPGDTDADVEPDAPACSGPNPAESCMDWGCPDGQECVQIEDGCAPSHCACEDDGWVCTADCGPDYECRPAAAGCPDEVPDFRSECGDADLYCEWGMECCCGECYGETFCQCTEEGWACGATDACFIESCAGRECDSDSDCEGGGVPTTCVEGVCTREGDTIWSPGPEIELSTSCDARPSDAYDVNSVTLEDDAIVVSVSFSGGCAEHLFRVCWDGAVMESDPVGLVLDLQHDSGGDACEAYLTEELRLPLTELRDAYEEWYGTDTATVDVSIAESSLLVSFDPCTGEDLPACPPECEAGAFERCGEACDPDVDTECGNEIGDGMTCVDGAWACTVHPPLGMGCNLVCRR